MTPNEVYEGHVVVPAHMVSDRYSIHKLIYTLFDRAQDERDFIFDVDHKQAVITVRSHRVPDKLKAQMRLVAAPKLNEKYLFKATVVAETSKTVDGKKRRRPIPSWEQDRLYEWFKNKMSRAGAEVLCTSLDENYPVTIDKPKASITLHQSVFTGEIIVTDEDLFQKAFTQGLGSSKTYGSGLIQLFQ